MAYLYSLKIVKAVLTVVKTASFSGLKVGHYFPDYCVFKSGIESSRLNSMLVSSSEAIIKVMGPKASAVKSIAKLLCSNAITVGVSFVVLSSIYLVDIFRGHISGTQLFKK